jgi:hypothetical protein
LRTKKENKRGEDSPSTNIGHDFPGITRQRVGQIENKKASPERTFSALSINASFAPKLGRFSAFFRNFFHFLAFFSSGAISVSGETPISRTRDDPQQ